MMALATQSDSRPSAYTTSPMALIIRIWMEEI